MGRHKTLERTVPSKFLSKIINGGNFTGKSPNDILIEVGLSLNNRKMNSRVSFADTLRWPSTLPSVCFPVTLHFELRFPLPQQTLCEYGVEVTPIDQWRSSPCTKSSLSTFHENVFVRDKSPLDSDATYLLRVGGSTYRGGRTVGRVWYLMFREGGWKYVNSERWI